MAKAPKAAKVAKALAKTGPADAGATERRFKTRVDIKPKNRDAMVALLNQQLADTFDLYSQTKQAHWNVKGSDFIALHELFDDLAAGVLEFVDLIAERATALGGFATGTARMAAGASRLPEMPVALTDGREYLEAIAERFAHLAATSRAAIDTAGQHDDQGTADLFTEVSRALDKSLWFVEAHLQG